MPKLKDIAFQRAIEGELVPVFSGGKLMGFRRKYNDKLLMFCLRHYGQDETGKRTTINYFSTRASASAAEASAGPGQKAAAAEVATTTVRTVITGPASGAGQAASDDGRARSDEAAAVLGSFEGVRLDPEAEAAIAAALEACAARARAADAAYDKGGDAAVEAAADDPGQAFIRADMVQAIAIGALEPPTALGSFEPFVPGEAPWELAGLEMPPELAAIEAKLERAAGEERKDEGTGAG